MEVDMLAGLAKTDRRRIRAEERRQKALRLRMAGASLEEVGRHVGVSRQAAHKLVSQALARLGKETAATAESYRTLELLRLDKMTFKAWEIMNSSDSPAFLVLQAISTLIRIAERRARLLGLNDLPPPPPPDVKVDTSAYFVPLFKEMTTEELLTFREVLQAMKARRYNSTLEQGQPRLATAVMQTDRKDNAASAIGNMGI
jgi:transposase-like protein